MQPIVQPAIKSAVKDWLNQSTELQVRITRAADQGRHCMAYWPIEWLAASKPVNPRPCAKETSRRA